MSPSLGDAFPANVRVDFAQKCITPGNVILCYSNAAGKDKRCVIVGINIDKSKVAVLLFNTDKPFIGNKRLESLQVHFKSDGNPYLKHDSYLNCAHIEFVPYQTLIDEIIANPDHVLDTMSKPDFDNICTVAANAKTASPKIIKTFGLSGYLFQSNN